LREKNDPTTGVLPPYYPTGEGLAMSPKYKDVEEIVMILWDYCMQLEDDYHRTASHEVLCQFAVAIMTVQYWEDVLMNMEGIDVYRFYF
jgi:hypothetical protein